MVRPIVKDPILLSQKAAPALTSDLPLAQDLLDTLLANRERCVGMAANMIGVPKQIIVFFDGESPVTMLNPEIIKSSDRYEAEEGCLSLEGVRKAARFRTVKVRWQNTAFQPRIKTFTGWTAQIIQHEIDHLNGILI